jgi:uncharacterized protein
MTRPAASPITFLPGPGEAGPLPAGLPAKRQALEAILEGLGSTLVAYSGGVDSATLLVEGHRVLGARSRGVIADSPSLPRAELRRALSLAEGVGIRVRVVATRELERERYRANAPDRCYHCKTELFTTLLRIAREEGFTSVAYGAVTDDLGDVRPGMEAAREQLARAPLLEAGFSKLETRLLARHLGLPVWDKPQSACLSSRIRHGVEVTAARLARVEAAEDWLAARYGLRTLRVRDDGGTARIEVAPGDIPRLSTGEAFATITLFLNKLGFSNVSMDPRGYRRADPMPDRAEETH